MNKTTIVICIIFAVNIITFLLYAIDKWKAIKGKWRIPEKVLLLWSLFGPWGGFTGMKVMHHKTHKKKFLITVPVFMVLHVVLLVGFIYLNLLGDI